MFTGLIQANGEILSISERDGVHRIAISAPEIAEKLHTGDSVSVSGVCLTALDITVDPPVFHADLTAVTVARTSLLRLRPGAVVNLELPTPAGTPLGGHVVQGHVDDTGKIVLFEPVVHDTESSGTDWWLKVDVPESVARYVVPKGSIAIEGISLTVAGFDGKTITAAIIPHTYMHTNLHTLKTGDLVNLEADVMMKFFEQRQKKAEPEFELTLDYLIANGY
jgi:riboflavin synthase